MATLRMTDTFSTAFLRKCHAAGISPEIATCMLQKEAASKVAREAVRTSRIRRAMTVMRDLIQ